MKSAIIYLIYIIIATLSFGLILIGYHNVDLSHNYLRLSYFTQIPIYTDYHEVVMFSDDTLTYDEVYLNGLTSIIIGNLGLLFSFLVMLFIALRNEKEKK